VLAGGETEAKTLCRFTARLALLRRAHPSLRTARYLHGRIETLPGVLNVAWFDERGAALAEPAWDDLAAHLLAVRRAAADPEGNADVTLALLNATADDREFVLPPPTLPWRIPLDTADAEGAESASGQALEVDRITVKARSLVLLAATARMAPA
jgi:isoamylase